MKMAKSEHINQSHKSMKTPISSCEQSRSALIDLVILTAVVSACGILIYPYVNLITFEALEILRAIISAINDEVLDDPMLYGCLGFGIFSASMVMLTFTVCISQTCGKSGCRGLRKAPKFDIQIETMDYAKNLDSNYSSNGSINGEENGLKKGLFELPSDYHKKFETVLKKMAPVNGKAVLVFRSSCGCDVNIMEVPGPKKIIRKINK